MIFLSKDNKSRKYQNKLLKINYMMKFCDDII